jgi:hypothetical protein
MGSGKPSNPGSHDSHLLISGFWIQRARGGRQDQALAQAFYHLYTMPLGGGALDGPDRDRLVDGSPPTGGLTWSSADPAADRGKGIRRPCNPVSKLIVSLSHGLNIPSRVRVHWASFATANEPLEIVGIRGLHREHRR